MGFLLVGDCGDFGVELGLSVVEIWGVDSDCVSVSGKNFQFWKPAPILCIFMTG